MSKVTKTNSSLGKKKTCSAITINCLRKQHILVKTTQKSLMILRSMIFQKSHFVKTTITGFRAKIHREKQYCCTRYEWKIGTKFSKV